MSKLKVSELFYSLQGEGRYQGVPSIFLRLFGCNFTCAGFGMPAGMKSKERLAVDPTKYTDYKQLPLVKTGCDSYASWDPRFKKFSEFYQSYDLANEMLALLPNGSWKGVHLVVTGGEPLLPGWQKQLPDLLDRVYEDGCENITFETNGTQELTEGMADRLLMHDANVEYTFSVSPKLAASGEPFAEAVQPDVIAGYFDWTRFQGNPTNEVYLKFVVDSAEQIAEVERVVAMYRVAAQAELNVYLMPVGGTGDLYFINNKNVAEMALARGWRYSARLQVDLWKNAWGT